MRECGHLAVKPPEEPLINPMDANNVLARASAVLATVPPAIEGSNGRHALFRAIALLYNDFGLEVPETFALLRDEYNPRCVPSWSEQALMAEIRDATKGRRFKQARGHLLKTGDQIPHNGQDPAVAPAYTELPDYQDFRPSPPAYWARAQVERFLLGRGIPQGFVRALVDRAGPYRLVYPSAYTQEQRPFVRLAADGRVLEASHRRSPGLVPLADVPHLRLGLGGRCTHAFREKAPDTCLLHGATGPGGGKRDALAYYRITEDNALAMSEKRSKGDSLRAVGLCSGQIVNAIFPLYAVEASGLGEEIVGENRRRVQGDALTSDRVIKGNPKYGAWVFPWLTPATQELHISEAVLDSLSLAAIDKLNGCPIQGPARAYSPTNGSAFPILLLRFARRHNIQVYIATDCDKAGDSMAGKIREWCAANGVAHAIRRVPDGHKDWNDAWRHGLASAITHADACDRSPDPRQRQILGIAQALRFADPQWISQASDPSALGILAPGGR